MFKVTSAAATQIQDSASQGGAEGMALRLAAIKHDDGSYDYKMGYDEVSEDDISFKSEEVMIVIAPEYVPLLDEATLDYVEMDDGQQQFIFLNPQGCQFRPAADCVVQECINIYKQNGLKTSSFRHVFSRNLCVLTCKLLILWIPAFAGMTD